MVGRRVRGLALAATIVAAAAALVPAATARQADESLVVTPSDTRPATTRNEYTQDTPFKLIITGTVTYGLPDGGEKTTLDALYCASCPDHRGQSPLVLETRQKNIPSSWGGIWAYHFAENPKYNPAHRYELTFGGADYGKLRFRIDKGCSTCVYTGSFSIRVVGAGGSEQTTKLRVDFLVKASGKPNIPISGAGAQPAISGLNGSGHATFTKKTGATRLQATETKGSIVHTDGNVRLQLGIISGSTYFPATHRLVLLLKVNSSNDPACEESGFLTGVRAATLTLLPVTGEPDLGTAIFAAVPVTKKILPGLSVTPCKGHIHGWEPGGGVSVRVVVRESTP